MKKVKFFKYATQTARSYMLKLENYKILKESEKAKCKVIKKKLETH